MGKILYQLIKYKKSTDDQIRWPKSSNDRPTWLIGKPLIRCVWKIWTTGISQWQLHVDVRETNQKIKSELPVHQFIWLPGK